MALDRPTSETDLATVRLTAEAERRLDITAKLFTVASRPVSLTRTFGGVVMVPAGRTALIVAPIPGVIELMPGDTTSLRPGASIAEGHPLLRLRPLLGAADKAQLAAALADAEGEVARTGVLAAAAEQALARIERLSAESAVSQRSLEEANAAAEAARAAQAGARNRRDALAAALGRRQHELDESAGSVTLASPLSGVLQDVSGLPGQTVGGGATVATVVSLDPVWIRVPVPAAEVAALAEGEQARIGALGARPGKLALRASRVPSPPPSANGLAATVDLLFELENAGGLVPGQRVVAELQLAGAAEALVVPWSAVLHDATGGTWVYVRVAPCCYRRERVLVERVAGELAVLVPGAGPPLGTEVVTDGAAEVFGAEMGQGR